MAKFFFCSALCSLLLLFFLSADSLFVKVAFLFSIVFFLLFSLARKSRFEARDLVILPLVFFFMIMVVPSRLYSPSFQGSYFVVLDVLALCVAPFLVSELRYYYIVRRFYFVFSFFVALFLVLDFIDLYDFKGAIFGGASENYTTALYLLLALLLIGLEFKHFNLVVSSYLIPVFLVSLYFESRFSVLISLVGIFLISVLPNSERKGVWEYIFIFLSLFSMIVLLVVVFGGWGCDYFPVICNDPRIYIWNDFFSNVSLGSYLLGVSFESCCEVISGDFKNNPHNSIIRSIAFYGLGAVLLLPLYLICFYTFLFISGSRLYSVLIILWLFRGWSDSIIFPYYFDFLFFPLIILMFQRLMRRDST